MCAWGSCDQAAVQTRLENRKWDRQGILPQPQYFHTEFISILVTDSSHWLRNMALPRRLHLFASHLYWVSPIRGAALTPPVSQSAPKEPDDLGLSTSARDNCEISHQSLRLLSSYKAWDDRFHSFTCMKTFPNMSLAHVWKKHWSCY